MKKLRIILLLLTVGVIGTLGSMFYQEYSSRKAPPEVSIREAMPENSLDKVHLVYHEAGKLKWVLDSAKADVFDGESFVDLKGVNLLIITENNGHLKITGDSGRYARESSDLWVTGNVKVLSGDDYVLYSKAIHWDIEKQIISTDGEARAEGPNGVISGKKMAIDVQKQKVYIVDGVNALLN